MRSASHLLGFQVGMDMGRDQAHVVHAFRLRERVDAAG